MGWGGKPGVSVFDPILLFAHLSPLFPFRLAVMRLRAAWCGHLAFCLSGQLCHLLALFTRTICRQHGHRHRSYRHGDRLSRLPGRHQGEQVPASECEFKPECLRNSLTDVGQSLCSRLLFYTFDSSHTLMQAVL